MPDEHASRPLNPHNGSDHPAVPEGHARLDGLIRYVDSEDGSRAHDSDHAIPKFASVRYDSLYKGIDLICYARGTNSECGFLVLPEPNPNKYGRSSTAETWRSKIPELS